MSDKFLIAVSRIAAIENVSGEHARRVVRQLEADEKIQVQRSPTGRGFVTLTGYEAVRDALRGAAHAA